MSIFDRYRWVFRRGRGIDAGLDRARQRDLMYIRSPVVTRGDPPGRLGFIFTKPGGLYFMLENDRVFAKFPSGEFDLIMATMHTKKMKGLWLPQTTLFTHPASFPEQLEGCNAPGLEIKPFGLTGSAVAMDKIFEDFGGFEEGKKLSASLLTLGFVDG